MSEHKVAVQKKMNEWIEKHPGCKVVTSNVKDQIYSGDVVIFCDKAEDFEVKGDLFLDVSVSQNFQCYGDIMHVMRDEGADHSNYTIHGHCVTLLSGKVPMRYTDCKIDGKAIYEGCHVELVDTEVGKIEVQNAIVVQKTTERGGRCGFRR